MPKQKTKSAAKKRFKLTGTGRALRRRAMQSHNLEKKSQKRKRRFSQDQPAAHGDEKTIKKLLGRG